MRKETHEGGHGPVYMLAERIPSDSPALAVSTHRNRDASWDHSPLELSRNQAKWLPNTNTLRAISSYGGDSLAAVEVRNWFVRSLEANVGVMEILTGKSIEGLAGDVVGRSKPVATVEKKEG